MDFTPTDALPGSPEKLVILQRRAQAGLPLFHPGDNQTPVEQRSLPAPYYKHDSSWVESAALAALADKRRELVAAS